jgi:hypothetical protein
MRYWICDISGSGLESRFEMDFEEPPAEGSVIAPGRLVYHVSAVVRLPNETSPGVIEVERVAERQSVPAGAGATYRPTTDPH